MQAIRKRLTKGTQSKQKEGNNKLRAEVNEVDINKQKKNLS